MTTITYTIPEERWASAAWQKPIWKGKGELLQAFIIPEYNIYPEFQVTELALRVGDEHLGTCRIESNIPAFEAIEFKLFTRTPIINGVLVLVKKHSEGRSIALPGCLVQVEIDVA